MFVEEIRCDQRAQAVAAIVVSSSMVAGVGDTLLTGDLRASQTFKFTQGVEEEEKVDG